jgi:hypothetical protein
MSARLRATIVGALVALLAASPNCASADDSNVPNERLAAVLQFALDNAPTNFKAIRGAKKSGEGDYYAVTGAANSICNGCFELDRDPGDENASASWKLMFDGSRMGSDSDVFAWLVQDLTPTLQSYGLHQNGDPSAGFMGAGTLEGWVGSASSYVIITTSPDADSSLTDFSITVGHNI